MRVLWVVLLLLSAVSASAQTVTFGQRGESATATRLVTLTSNPEEQKVEFLGRVGRFLTNFTSNNSVEGCASICQVPNAARWGVVVHTNQSVLACTIVSVCPEGMEDTQVGIHSHPEVGVYNLSRVDSVFLRARNDPRKDDRIFKTLKYDGFSHFDKRAGEGYLVENGRLLHFDGHTSHDLGPVSASVLGTASP